MKVKIKKIHPSAPMPIYATPGSACMDICWFDLSIHNLMERESEYMKESYKYDEAGLLPGHSLILRTGLFFEIPDDHVMLIFSRSGHGFKSDIRLSNCVGVIDSDFRGEVKIKLSRDKDESNKRESAFKLKIGDRIAQAIIMPRPKIELIELDELSDTIRAEGGFGSTGK